MLQREKPHNIKKKKKKMQLGMARKVVCRFKHLLLFKAQLSTKKVKFLKLGQTNINVSRINK